MIEIRKILLAEDNPKDTELTLEALDEYKLANRVVAVKDGVEALDYLRCTGAYADRKAGNPAVIILDIKMPRMDGIETLREIRQDPSLKMIPVVMLTSSREEKDLYESYELGVNAYVVKPVNFPSFVDAVKQIGGFWAVVNELPPDNGQQYGVKDRSDK
ncbi:MAG: two-component system response regulator [Candidatus Cloacimonetes bacterium HGW-Cloacimonetes-1]|jgi:CheY-like chemotaxis protein|nr:MAG: two-component system response regulator [Candidatus Cloacimonetes bacterium HGW-Cloacimonetes-1]